MPPRRLVAAAFTVIELLALLAILALLAGVLLPSLSSARSAARVALCAQQQRRLHAAAIIAAQSDDERIPGVNTTNARFLKMPHTFELLADTTSHTPTSVFDWISPSLGPTASFSTNRARRTQQIFNDLACPSATRHNDTLFGYAPDAADFQAILANDGFLQVSYLSPAAFHLAGRSFIPLAKFRTFAWRGPAVPPDDYFPRLDRIGPPASKVFLSDATRYLASRSRLDFDISPAPKYFGSFLSSSPIYRASREFGSAANLPEFPDENYLGQGPSVYPHNRDLTYRHKARLVVTWFDGHVTTMNENESKTDASHWFPTGSVFNAQPSGNATDQARAFHRDREELR